MKRKVTTMTVSIRFTDDYILDIDDVSTVRNVTDTNYLEVTKHNGTTTRKDYFNLNNIIQYTILTDPVNNITAPH